MWKIIWLILLGLAAIYFLKGPDRVWIGLIGGIIVWFVIAVIFVFTTISNRTKSGLGTPIKLFPLIIAMVFSVIFLISSITGSVLGKGHYVNLLILGVIAIIIFVLMVPGKK
ncbi:hypothetical protein ACFL1K_00915 [Candidatus Omnitrophota bacterium]